VADDERLTRRILEDTLTGWGYEVILATNGNEAWDLLQSEDAPSLVILDWVMPGLDGLEICRRLRMREKGDYVYAILLTAKTDPEDIIRGLESGADDYILKPFNAEELKYRIKIGARIVDLEQRVLNLARTDPLTELANRRAFMERLEAESNRAQRQDQTLGIIILDLDHFKNINDNYGHQVGDLVLREVGRGLCNVCRSYDFIGRYGGEEFIVGLPGTDLDVVNRTAERIRISLEKNQIPLADEDRFVSITASLGGAVLDKSSDESIDSLIKRADDALYAAKSGGRNRVVISHHRNRRSKNPRRGFSDEL